jgi:hypothetical protein
MKKEKTYFDGIIVGFGVTLIIYSILLVYIIYILTPWYYEAKEPTKKELREFKKDGDCLVIKE